ncbi:carbohydrate kinase family protein [Halobaculum gomorrense]|uniref:Ribokinase/sulfofructose kinase n=1 Tax=Halobaculum gomorrense TaxID=43928 RepID=A0A1M5RJQ7_9EURY|nr:carbohydrate kinase family protein [Halobaculum gomorrense]SHH26349.1 ribokinase/sulfofructose kinase [Halobaculum gomorrense]
MTRRDAASTTETDRSDDAGVTDADTAVPATDTDVDTADNTVDTADTADTAAPEVVTVGAATVDRTYHVSNIPEPDGGAYAGTVAEAFGGVGANVALASARLGRATGLIARLGDDDVGARVAADIDATPIDDARVRRKLGTSTHCVILRDDDGKRSIVTAGDSAKRLRLTTADRAYLADADAAFLTAYNPDEVHRDAIAIAERADAPPFVFDLSGPLAELAGRGARRETIDRWVRAADLFVLGEVAAESYLGCSGREAAEALLSQGANRVAVTAGPAGAVLATDTGLHELSAFEVPVADETGAGDAYVAALIDRWVLGDDTPREAGRFAAAAAALNVTEAGARGGLATRRAVEAFLADR